MFVYVFSMKGLPSIVAYACEGPGKRGAQMVRAELEELQAFGRQ